MSRSIWKGPYINLNFYLINVVNILFCSRNSKIIPKFLGLNFNVHNGKKYIKLTIIESMVNSKFGDFCFTRSSMKSNKNKNGSKN